MLFISRILGRRLLSTEDLKQAASLRSEVIAARVEAMVERKLLEQELITQMEKKDDISKRSD